MEQIGACLRTGSCRVCKDELLLLRFHILYQKKKKKKGKKSTNVTIFPRPSCDCMLGTAMISTLVRVVAVWKTPFISSYLWLVLSLVSQRNMKEIWCGYAPILTSAQVRAFQANVCASTALCSPGKNVNGVTVSILQRESVSDPLINPRSAWNI